MSNAAAFRRRARFVYLDEVPTEPKAMPIQLAAAGPDPEGDSAFRQLNQVLQSEVRRIPPLMRNVMLLRDIDGLPMKEVADRLGITVSAAKSRLVRARTEMRSRIKRHYPCIGSLPSSLFSQTAAPLSRLGRHTAVSA